MNRQVFVRKFFIPNVLIRLIQRPVRLLQAQSHFPRGRECRAKSPRTKQKLKSGSLSRSNFAMAAAAEMIGSVTLDGVAAARRAALLSYLHRWLGRSRSPEIARACFQNRLGSTGYQPVLAGNLPDSFRVLATPAGRLPTGTGKLPVLPVFKTRPNDSAQIWAQNGILPRDRAAA